MFEELWLEWGRIPQMYLTASDVFESEERIFMWIEESMSSCRLALSLGDVYPKKCRHFCSLRNLSDHEDLLLTLIFLFTIKQTIWYWESPLSSLAQPDDITSRDYLPTATTIDPNYCVVRETLSCSSIVYKWYTVAPLAVEWVTSWQCSSQ